MHNDSDDSPNPLRRSALDTSRHLPAAGCWNLVHGHVAAALVKLAREVGQMVAEGPGLPLPEGFSAPVGAGVWWKMEVEGRMFLVREDELHGYLKKLDLLSEGIVIGRSRRGPHTMNSWPSLR